MDSVADLIDQLRLSKLKNNSNEIIMKNKLTECYRPTGHQQEYNIHIIRVLTKGESIWKNHGQTCSKLNEKH